MTQVREIKLPKPTGRLVGYARVSTSEQDLQSQIDGLIAQGVARRDIYKDHGISGAKTTRPELDRMLADVEPGDTVVVFKTDRLGRNAGHVITTIDKLVSKGVHVRTLDGIDTTTSGGRAMLQMLAVFANMEREFIIERTKAGLVAAKAKGRVGGRPRAMTSAQAKIAVQQRSEGKSVAEIATILKVSRPTIYRYLDAAE